MSGSKIKVCHIASGDLWAGAEVQIFNLVTSQYYREHVEASCILLNDGILERKLRAEGIAVEVVQQRENTVIGLISKISRLVKRNECNLIHTHRYKENLIGVCVSGLCSGTSLVKTVYGLREIVTGWRRLKRTFIYFADSMLSKWFIDKTIVVTEDIEREISAIVPKDRLKVINNSIDTRALQKPHEKAGLKSVGLENARLVGTFCRLVPIKGLDYFVRAARQLTMRSHYVRFVIGGEGPEQDGLQELCTRLGLQDKFIFTGFVDDIYSYISCFDIFVISSRHEGFPTAALEAMALGVPVVATRVGGIPEIIEHRKTGILVEPGDESALADGIESLLCDRGLYECIKQHAYKEVFELYSNESQGRKVVEVYREICRGNGKVRFK